MAEVTVEQLAKTVGTDPDKLLSQMKDAGLTPKSADEGGSDDAFSSSGGWRQRCHFTRRDASTDCE